MLSAKNEVSPVVAAGTHVARCIGVIDLGTQYSEKFGNSSRKILVKWELPNELMDDGRPVGVSKKYTLSLNEKANLRKDLGSWLGRGITVDEERDGFPMGNMLGAPCLLSIIHADSNGKTYANVAGVMSVPKGTVVPDQSNPMVAYDVENGRDSVYEKLPDWVKTIIEESKEFKDSGGATEEDEPVEAEAPFDSPVTTEQLQVMQHLYQSKKVAADVFVKSFLNPYGASKPKDLTEHDAALVIAALEAV
jgi:hypothetical protein